MIRNVVAFIDGSEASVAWLAKAVDFCRCYAARLHVTLLMERIPADAPEASTPEDALDTDFAPLGSDAADLMFPARLGDAGVAIEISRVWKFFSDLPLAASEQSRVMDVALVGPATTWSDRLLRRRVIERIVTDSGAPVMIVPENWNPTLIRTVALGWNGSSQAARAARALVPLAEQGAKVEVIVVKDGDGLRGEQSCSEIAGHLANQGFRVEADVRFPEEQNATEVLEKFAACHGAQLLVVGGYGRSRLTERLFGGVSKDLIADAHIPVLMVG